MNRFNLANGKAEAMGPPGLTRYGSAPGSLLASIADSVISSQGQGQGQGQGRTRGDLSVMRSEAPVMSMSRFYPGDPSPSASALTSSASDSYSFGTAFPTPGGPHKPAAAHPHPHPHPPAPLVRHSSSPAGLLSHLLLDPQQQQGQGLSGTKGMGGYSHGGTETVDLLTNSRLTPQWSFSRQDSLSQLSDISIPDMGESVTTSWTEAGSIFSNHLGKRARDDNDDFMASLGNMDEMEYMQMHQDAAACKLRAKRGCATHPRSIAERERRTRISKRLRKLQELVPNMDKQTSTSDMLDLAVQYIKDLQGQLQKIKEEQQKCICSSKVL